jgi:hypothetical protein
LRYYARARKHPNQNIPVFELEDLRKEFLEQTNALGIPFPEAPQLYEKVVREFLNPTPAKPTPKPTPPPPPKPAPRTLRNTPIDDDLLAALSKSPSGHSSGELAEILFGIAEATRLQDDAFYHATTRVVTTVARLRKKGYRIITAGTVAKLKRYVLQTN